jgi:hypothetical protein
MAASANVVKMSALIYLKQNVIKSIVKVFDDDM